MTEARERFAEAAERARTEPVFLTRHGRRTAVILGAEQYADLVAAAEDAEDIAAAEAARAEVDSGAATIPWEQVRADLGL